MAGADAPGPSLAVLGAGSWGTTFSLVLARAGASVRLWARREEVAQEIREEHRNSRYLGVHELPETIAATSDIAEAVDGVDGVVLAIPAQSLRATLEPWADAGALPEVPVLSLVKGIEQGSLARMSTVAVEAGGIAPESIAVLSGPNLSAEIARGEPCASVVAAADPALAETVATWCAGPAMRVYTSTDVLGVEIAGAAKNVIALAVGAAAGLGLGDNARASLITRGLAEISRLGTALGADASTFSGLAGMGDLVATCASPLSRNHRLGAALGRGLALPDAIAEVGQTAEGAATSQALLGLARRLGVDMPITEGVADTIAGTRGIREVTAAMLARPIKAE